MAQVIFLRGVNVGRTRRLGAKEFAEKLGLVNLGAAGTFVSTNDDTADAIEKKIRAALPFETEVIVRPAEEILALSSAKKAAAGVERFVTVLAAAPAKRPRLPINLPAGDKWLVSAVKIEGRLAMCHRRIEAHGKGFYPNELIEKACGVPATTRGWPTIEAIWRALKPKAAATTARRSRAARRR